MIPVQNAIFQYLSTNGDGTGTTNQIADFGATPTDFYIQPPVGETYILERMNILIIDLNFSDATKYAAEAALTTGITIKVLSQDDERVLQNFTPLTIKRTVDYTLLAGVDNVTAASAGADSLKIRWTFERGWDELILNGDNKDKLVVHLADSLTGITDQLMFVQGYKKDNKDEANLKAD